MVIKNDGLAHCYESYSKDLLKDTIFRKKAFVSGDHTHCLFDGTEISAKYENTQWQGYCSSNNHWICTECFEECLRRGYKLSLFDNSIEMLEKGLRSNKVATISLNNERYIIKRTSESIIVIHNSESAFYDDFLTMEREHNFYGKSLREIIGDLYISID